MIIFTIIGAIIGAGFISGQEIYVFFFKHGIKGAWGLVLCNFLIGFSVYKILKIIKENEINNYEDFINLITNFRFTRINKYISIIFNFFLLMSFFVMIAGFGSFFEQEFKINRLFGSVLLAIIAFFMFIGNIKNIVKINEKLVPVLIGVIILVGLNNLCNINIDEINYIVTEKFSIYWIIDAIVYASYNVLLIIPCLINLKKYLKNKKQIIWISLILTITLLIISALLFLLLLKYRNSNDVDMPLLFVINNNYNFFSIAFGIILLIAIFTTAISIGIGLIKNITNKNNIIRISFIVCFFSIIVANFRFATLIKYLYPLMGYVGLIEMYYLIKYNF